MVDTTKKLFPFDTANVPGPKMASGLKPVPAGKIIAKANRPLLVVGDGIKSQPDWLERAIKFGEKGVAIAATGVAVKAFIDAGYEKANSENFHALTSYLMDPEWKGFDGNGQYDVVVFMGTLYYYSSAMMQALKNFAPHLRVLSIDRHYHPNAAMSFGNLSDDEFLEAVDEVLANM